MRRSWRSYGNINFPWSHDRDDQDRRSRGDRNLFYLDDRDDPVTIQWRSSDDREFNGNHFRCVGHDSDDRCCCCCALSSLNIARTQKRCFFRFFLWMRCLKAARRRNACPCNKSTSASSSASDAMFVFVHWDLAPKPKYKRAKFSCYTIATILWKSLVIRIVTIVKVKFWRSWRLRRSWRSNGNQA